MIDRLKYEYCYYFFLQQNKKFLNNNSLLDLFHSPNFFSILKNLLIITLYPTSSCEIVYANTLPNLLRLYFKKILKSFILCTKYP
jgi:hypothetical protein